MSMSISAWLPISLFAALVLVAALHLLSASGHFPIEHRAASLRTPLGIAILFGTSALVLAALVVGAFATWRLVPWYAAVIGAGLAILAAPLALRPFPDDFVNGRASLLTFTAIAAALALGLLSFPR
jgi:hypothetical protein